MILIIDTSRLDLVTVSLKAHGKTFTRSVVPDRKTQEVLPFIESLLQEVDAPVSAISDIQVHLGPGSFTGLRVGVTIANTLGTLLQVPINSLPVGELVKPQYS